MNDSDKRDTLLLRPGLEAEMLSVSPRKLWEMTMVNHIASEIQRIDEERGGHHA